MDSKVDFRDNELLVSQFPFIRTLFETFHFIIEESKKQTLSLCNNFQYRNFKTCSVRVYANMRKTILSDEFELLMKFI